MSERQQPEQIVMDAETLSFIRRVVAVLNAMLSPWSQCRAGHTFQGALGMYGLLSAFPPLLRLPRCIPGFRPTLSWAPGARSMRTNSSPLLVSSPCSSSSSWLPSW